MSKRGNPACPSFCNSCRIDCRCQYCNYCHSCQKHNTSNHTWQHSCLPDAGVPSSAGGHESVSRFLTETSDRFTRFFESEIFTINVGEEKTYFVHSEALNNASTVLKRQVNSEMKEGKTKTIHLKDITDRPVAFSLFIQFCYFGGYGYDDAEKEDALSIHASVYVLAEKIGALDLKTIALQKATALCASARSTGASDQPVYSASLKTLQYCLADAVPIIYDGTYDANPGKMPSSLVETGVKQQGIIPVISRDGFRILLAKFAAAYIDQLRKNESFTAILQEYPAFSADILLFTMVGSQILVDEKGNLRL